MRGTIKNNLLLLLLAVLAGYWHAHNKINGPVHLKLGLTVKTTLPNHPYQIYCHSFKEYTGDTRTDGYYTPELLIADDTYRIVADIRCGNDTTHIRFDPIQIAGEVSIQNMRVRGSYWQEIPLDQALANMKPMNAIEQMVLKNDEIVIQAIGNDPYIQLTDQVQELIQPGRYDLHRFALKYSLIALLIFKALAWALGRLLHHGPTVLSAAQQVDQRFNHHTARLFGFFHQRFAQHNEMSSILIILAFVMYLFSSWVFARHMVNNTSGLFFFALGFLTLQFLIILSTYVVVIHAFGQLRWLRTLVGFLLLITTLVIAVDVSLFSLNGMHVSHGLGMLTHGGIEQFFNNLKFTGLAQSELTMYLIAIALALVLSFSIVWFLDHKTQRFKFKLSVYHALLLTAKAILLVFLLQFLAAGQMPSRQIVTYEKHHPIGLSFFDEKGYQVSYPVQARPFARRDQLPTNPLSVSDTGIKQVYLFVFESLREDAVNAESAPHMHRFKSEGWHFSRMLASGNASHFGWYAAINGVHPFFVERYARLDDKRGSLPIQLFRQMGFEINVYSAKDLSYLGLDQVLFGQNLDLVDYLSEHPQMSPPEHDRRTADELIHDIKNKDPNVKQLNIVFFDSTHYPYRWNDAVIDSIEPYQGTPAEGTDLSSAVRIMKTNKELIYNRYLNAVKHMDHLFGEVMTVLRELNRLDHSVVAVVGDHGQQFMEHGYMLHGFTLFREDIDVPIYFQGPNLPRGQFNQSVGHTDIMPTLLDAVGLERQDLDALDGQSLLAENHRPYILTAVAGEQNTPYSFVLTSTEWKLFFKTESNNPFNFNRLFVTMITDANDEVFIPGDGTEQAYRTFLDVHFNDFLNNMVITQ